MYYVEYKSSVFEPCLEYDDRHDIPISEQYLWDKSYVMALVRKMKLRAATVDEIKQTAVVVKQYRHMAKEVGLEIKEIVEQTIKSITSGLKQKERNLDYKYINSCINNYIKKQEEKQTTKRKQNAPNPPYTEAYQRQERMAYQQNKMRIAGEN